jgi:hypothetical protein
MVSPRLGFLGLQVVVLFCAHKLKEASLLQRDKEKPPRALRTPGRLAKVGHGFVAWAMAAREMVFM